MTVLAKSLALKGSRAQPSEADLIGEARDSPHKRIRVLTHRWLPLLLRRVGVGARSCDLVRERFVPDEELSVRLKVVRDAALLSAAHAWSKHERQTAELADAAAAIAGQLALAIELGPREPEVARCCLDRATQQLIGLLVVGNIDHDALDKPAWWQRLRYRWSR